MAPSISPGLVFAEYEQGIRFKTGLGSRGLYEQNRLNERFFAGDQWAGARCGEDRPLVRHNILKRIGDHKLAVIGSTPVSVTFSADGIPFTLPQQERVRQVREDCLRGRAPAGETLDEAERIHLATTALSDYFRVTAERVKLDDLKETVLRCAYIGGTGVLYTYWDDAIPTGLYADRAHTLPLTGDIGCEVLDIENVYFGDPNLDDVQSQPYILVAGRQSVHKLREEARRFGCSGREAENIQPDRETAYMAGEFGPDEPPELQKATVLTRFWKGTDPDTGETTVFAARVCRGAVVRGPWNLGIRLYPLAKFNWERRRGCAYGASEVTELIPNQIAINRMLTASVWAMMMAGMPIMVVNGDVVTVPLTNDPGQIVTVYGGEEEVSSAVRYVQPPAFSGQWEDSVATLINATLTQSGANSALLGDVSPNNTSAILAVREAASLPLTMIQRRFYSFCEDVARIWAEFWITQYGSRELRIEDERGVWYFPFDADRYRNLVLTARIDVSSSTLFGESQTVETLNRLFEDGAIDVTQYLSRLPKGTVPALPGLLRELKEQQEAGQAQSPAQAEKQAEKLADKQAEKRPSA